MLNSQTIKNAAIAIGFDACGIAAPAAVDSINAAAYGAWIVRGMHADMTYMERSMQMRLNPLLWWHHAKSIIVMLWQYYPKTWQDPALPQISCYAYGEDYHRFLSRKLRRLLQTMRQHSPALQGRCSVDSGSILEKYWAVQAGLGMMGQNSLLINPVLGSFVFIAIMAVDDEVDSYDKPLQQRTCRQCGRCIEACPAQAIERGCAINAHSCISYRTQRGIAGNSCGYIWGCDICQRACPYNQNVSPKNSAEWLPNKELLNMTLQRWNSIDEEEFGIVAQKSPIRRAKLQNIKFFVKNLKNS